MHAVILITDDGIDSVSVVNTRDEGIELLHRLTAANPDNRFISIPVVSADDLVSYCTEA